MSETAWNTVRGKSESGGAGAFELSFGYPDESAYASAVEQLVADEVASGIAGQDPTLWGPAAEEEAGKRLAWVDLPERSKALVTEISTLEVELRERGLARIVLCGMGGSSLAPEVICAAAGVELVVLDSSDPDFVRAAPERDLAVPDRPFTFHEFLIAQAVGDGQVLAEKGRPVLRLHLDGPGSLDAVRQALL